MDAPKAPVGSRKGPLGWTSERVQRGPRPGSPGATRAALGAAPSRGFERRGVCLAGARSIIAVLSEIVGRRPGDPPVLIADAKRAAGLAAGAFRFGDADQTCVGDGCRAR